MMDRMDAKTIVECWQIVRDRLTDALDALQDGASPQDVREIIAKARYALWMAEAAQEGSIALVSGSDNFGAAMATCMAQLATARGLIVRVDAQTAGGVRQRLREAVDTLWAAEAAMMAVEIHNELVGDDPAEAEEPELPLEDGDGEPEQV